MKIKYLIIPVISFMTILIITGFNLSRDERAKIPQDNGKQAHQGLNNGKNSFDKEWNEFKTDAELRISANEKRIEEFKVKIKTSGKEVKVKYDKEVVVLEQKDADLQKKINEFKFESKDKWTEFKRGFNNDMDFVGKSIKDLFAKKD